MISTSVFNKLSEKSYIRHRKLDSSIMLNLFSIVLILHVVVGDDCFSIVLILYVVVGDSGFHYFMLFLSTSGACVRVPSHPLICV